MQVKSTSAALETTVCIPPGHPAARLAGVGNCKPGSRTGNRWLPTTSLACRWLTWFLDRKTGLKPAPPTQGPHTKGSVYNAHCHLPQAPKAPQTDKRSSLLLTTCLTTPRNSNHLVQHASCDHGTPFTPPPPSSRAASRCPAALQPPRSAGKRPAPPPGTAPTTPPRLRKLAA